LKNYYPIALRLEGAPALVVGGGKVAERKAASLRAAGARIRIVSPKLTGGLNRLVKKGEIDWTARGVRQADIAGASIIISATDDEAVNRSVSRWARERGIPVNVVDAPALSAFISPAVFRKAGSIITVYTDGKDPVLSRDLKNFIRKRWDDFLYYRNRP
jgi:siroheme synthase-like protein